MTIADFLMKEVKDKGWLSIANLYFDNGLTIFPFTVGGRVCMSPSAEMVFCTNRLDSTNSYKFNRDYVAMDDRYNGLFQTITVTSFDMLQHFDTHLFALDRINPSGADEFLTPVYPKPAEIEGLTAGEDGLYPGKDVVGFQTKKEASTINLYPDLKPLSDYHGFLIDAGKMFIKNQKAFVKAVQKIYGISDCI